MTSPTNPPPSELARYRALVRDLAVQLRLLDRIIVEHHRTSLVTWEGSCPVCTEAGGVDFFAETGGLLRRAAHSATPSAGRDVGGEVAAIWRCPQCLFGFAAEHTDSLTGEHSCPLCELEALRASAPPGETDTRQPYFDGKQPVGAPGCTCSHEAPTVPVYRGPFDHLTTCPHYGANYWRAEMERAEALWLKAASPSEAGGGVRAELARIAAIARMRQREGDRLKGVLRQIADVGCVAARRGETRCRFDEEGVMPCDACLAAAALSTPAPHEDRHNHAE